MKKALTVGLHIRHKARLFGRLSQVEFQAASNSIEALTILQSDENMSLLVVDENLPDSIDFLKKIKTLKIPTIYCSESEKSGDFLRALVQEMGVSVVLTKPVDPNELVRKAGELLSADRIAEQEDDTVQSQMKARLAALWEKFGPANKERLRWLRSQVDEVVEGTPKNEADRREMEREAHKMVGSLGTFGFPRASILAREIELHVSPGAGLAQLDGGKLLGWVQSIERELSQAPQGVRTLSATDGGIELLIVSDNKELVQQLERLERNGVALKSESVSSWGKARESWFLRAPELVVLDLCGENAEERRTLLSSVAAKLSTIPVLILLPKEVWSQPDGLDRYVGFPVLFHPYEADVLDSTVLKLLADSNNRPKPKILAVDDDPQILDALTVLLTPLKFDLTTISDPLAFWDTLEQCTPDLLILDIDMPFLSGIELCRGVRSSPRWWELPVLFLSASSDAENLNRIFSVGADDFVPKPFAGPELATRVINRLVRSNGSVSNIKTADFKSGLDGLRNILSEERWKDSQIVIALLRVWNDAEIVNQLGVPIASQLNKQFGNRFADRLRGMGAIARWRAHEFVVVLPGQTLGAGSHLLSTLLSQDEIVEFHRGQNKKVRLQVLAGSTLMENSKSSLEAALRYCQSGLEAVTDTSKLVYSKEMIEPPAQSDSERCQILILEPDQATGRAVENLLRERGYHPRWESDTESAVQRLTSDPPTLEAKVIFISSGGLRLLRKLGPLTKLVNVVVAVSTEKELVSAFDGGAFDCIEKPCKVGTLLKRLERAVGG